MKRTVGLLVCGVLGGCSTDSSIPVAGAPRWALSLGGIADDRPTGIAIDSFGDVVVAGGHASAGFVTKHFAGTGVESWSHVLGDDINISEVTGLALASDDSIVVTGNYIGTVDFGGQTLVLDEPTPPDRGDTFVAKYASNGDLVWVRGRSTTEDSSGAGVTVGREGRIGVLVRRGKDAFVQQLDADGTLQWEHSIAGVYPNAIAAAPDGGLVAVGDTAAGAVWKRFDVGGDVVGSGRVGVDGASSTQVAFDASGHVVIQTIENQTSDVLHVLDDDGSETWTASLADHTSLSPQFRTLSTASDGRILTAAWDDAPFNADHPETVTGSMELVAYDANGQSATATVGRRMIGGLAATILRGSAIGANGTVAVTGTFGGMIDFDTGSAPLVAHGDEETDVFVLLLDAP